MSSSLLVRHNLLSAQLAQPVVIASFYLIFPLGLILLLKSAFAEREKNGGKVQAKNLFRAHISFTEIIKITPKSYMALSFVLIIGAYVVSYPINSVSWSHSEPFGAEHAIGFGTGASFFYGIYLMFFSKFAAISGEQESKS